MTRNSDPAPAGDRAVSMSALFSKRVAHPLWDVRDRSQRLRELAWLERHQWEPLEEKKTRQRQRLQAVLRYAHRHCEYYYYRTRSAPVLRRPEDLRLWPILEKEDVRRNKDRLISNEFGKANLIQAKTGGSTGTSLEIYFDRKCQETRNAAALWCDRWSGWDLGEWRAALWGNPPEPKTWKQKIRNAWLDRFIYLDTVAMTEEAMDRFLQDIRRRRIAFLYGHAHSLFILARHAADRRIEGLGIRGIVSTSMMLLPSERRTIETVFQCPVTDRYGCEEVGLIGCECEKHGGFHLNIDHLYVEVLRPDGTEALPGEEGDIVVTDLMNRGMPLIRYRVGDVGVLADRPCACGRGLPLLERVTGRTADFLVRTDGSLVAGVSLVERTLTAIAGIAQLQIVQETRTAVRLRVVPDDRYDAASERRLLAEMTRALGEGMEFRIEKAARLEQSRNGKYRFSICRVPHSYQSHDRTTVLAH
jgi:phenylacetate-CoA ligase